MGPQAQGLINVFTAYVDRLATQEREQPASSAAQRLQLVSLFGKVYLEERLRTPSDAHLWRKVELIHDAAGKPVSMAALEHLNTIDVYESRPSAALRDPPQTPATGWYRVSNDLSRQVARDALLSLFLHVWLSQITTSERRYYLSKSIADGNSAPVVVNTLIRELDYLPEEGSAQRVIWPLLNGFEALKLDTGGAVRLRQSHRLPRWVLEHDWLVRWVMVLPLEFRADDTGMPPEVSVRHLESYVQWAIEHCEPTGDKDAQQTAAILDATERLIELICDQLSVGRSQPFTLQDFDGNEFSYESGKRTLDELRRHYRLAEDKSERA